MSDEHIEKQSKPGPDEERLKIEGVDWKEAAKRAMSKEKPPEGWPKPETAKEEKPSE